MNENLSKAKDIIEKGVTVFAYVENENIIKSELKGIAFVASLCNDGKDLSKGAAADKIVGKAAALLFVLLELKCVYAHVLSEGGKGVFDKYGIEYTYGTLTSAIQNRHGTGLCPMETAVADIDEPRDALNAVNEVLCALRLQNG